MKRQSNLRFAFVLALALHGIAGVCASNLLGPERDRIIPLFQEGISGLALTLAPARNPAPVEPSEQMENPKDDPELKEPQPAADDDFVVERRKDGAAESSPDNNADLRQKGVTTLATGVGEIRPRYPLGSRLRGEEGVVTVKVTVNVRGRAENVEVVKSSGFRALNRAAVDAALGARYVAEGGRKLTSGGEAILTFRFKLVD